MGCRASADAAAPPAPAAGASFFAGLLKRLKLFATNLAIDAVRDKDGILRLAKSFPPKVQSTFIGLFECYVEQVRLARAAASLPAGAERAARARRSRWALVMPLQLRPSAWRSLRT